VRCFSFGEFQQSRASRVFEARVDHPSDKIEPFFKLALRYGKEEFLQALTKIARRSGFNLAHRGVLTSIAFQSKSTFQRENLGGTPTTR
jgi:hypothetical protein